MSTPTLQQARKAFLDARRGSIGSSDLAALAGLSPWNTPAKVYLSKVGLLEDGPMTSAQEFGLDAEPMLRGAFCRRFKTLVSQPGQLRHPERAIITANCDAIVAASPLAPTERPMAVGDPVELKTCWEFSPVTFGEEGTDEVPPCYYVQAQGQLAVTCADWCHFAVLVHGGYQFYHVPRHDRLISLLEELAEHFWTKHVLPRVPPPFDWDHPSIGAIAGCLKPPVKNKRILLGDDVLRFWTEQQDLSRQKALLDKQIKKIKAFLDYQMGDAEIADLPGGWVLERRDYPEVDIPAHTRKGHHRYKLIRPDGNPVSEPNPE